MRIKTIDEIKECPNVEFDCYNTTCHFHGHDDVPSEFMNSEMMTMVGRECRIRKIVEGSTNEFHLDVNIDGKWKSFNWFWTDDMVVYEDEQPYQDIDMNMFI